MCQGASITSINIITSFDTAFYQPRKIYTFYINIVFISSAFHLSSNKKCPHILCLIISVSSVKEPLSKTQLRTISFLEVSFTKRKGFIKLILKWNLTIMSWYFYTSRSWEKGIFKFKSFMTEKGMNVTSIRLVLLTFQAIFFFQPYKLAYKTPHFFLYYLGFRNCKTRKDILLCILI